MGSEEANEDEKERSVLDLCHQAVGVALDVEDHPIGSQKIGRPECCADLTRARPGGLFNHREPESKRSFRIRVLGPEFNERVPAEDPQLPKATMLPGWEQAPLEGAVCVGAEWP